MNLNHSIYAIPKYSDSYSESIEQIDTFIRPDVSPQLQSLRLPYLSQKLNHWIFTGAFPHLKICHFYDFTYKNIFLPSSTTNTSQALRQRTIQERKRDGFEKIL